MKRIQYEIANGNSGELVIEGANVTVSGRSSAKSYLTPGQIKRLENTARVTVTPVSDSKSKKSKSTPKPERRTGWPPGKKPKSKKSKSKEPESAQRGDE